MSLKLTVIRPICTICDESCDAPRLIKWDHLTNEKIKLCSDICLEAYSNMNEHHRKKLGKLIKDMRKENEIKKNNISVLQLLKES